MVSMTTSIESAFGSRMMVRGFLLNNQLTDFSFAPEQDGKPVANRVEAGKRPRSSMAPTIVLNPDRTLRLVTGSPGGSRIINYTARSVIAVLDWKLDPQSAVARPGHSVKPLTDRAIGARRPYGNAPCGRHPSVRILSRPGRRCP